MSALALIAGGFLGAVAAAFLFGCQCCGKRMHVIWRSCYVIQVTDCEPEALLPRQRGAPTGIPIHVARMPPRLQQSRMPTLPERGAAAEARAWNSLRDALGPDVPDTTLAELLEAHGDDIDAAAQAYYATPRGSGASHARTSAPRGVPAAGGAGGCGCGVGRAHPGHVSPAKS